MILRGTTAYLNILRVPLICPQYKESTPYLSRSRTQCLQLSSIFSRNLDGKSEADDLLRASYAADHCSRYSLSLCVCVCISLSLCQNGTRLYLIFCQNDSSMRVYLQEDTNMACWTPSEFRMPCFPFGSRNTRTKKRASGKIVTAVIVCFKRLFRYVACVTDQTVRDSYIVCKTIL